MYMLIPTSKFIPLPLLTVSLFKEKDFIHKTETDSQI